MKTSIDFLPEVKQDELKRIVKYLESRYTKINSIILYGDYTSEKGNGEDEYKILLVLTTEKKAKRHNFRKDLINNLHTHVYLETQVRVMFHGYDYICSMLKNKNFFFCDTFNEGVLLANAWHRAYDVPVDIKYSERAERAKEGYDNWMRKAGEMLSQYKLSFESESYNIASFFLHQVTEIYLMTANFVITDYRPRSHDLFELFEIVCDAESRFGREFDMENADEMRMLKLLDDAYSRSRYDLDFVVRKEQLVDGYEKVKNIMRLCEVICAQKIEYFTVMGNKNKRGFCD